MKYALSFLSLDVSPVDGLSWGWVRGSWSRRAGLGWLTAGPAGGRCCCLESGGGGTLSHHSSPGLCETHTLRKKLGQEN